MTQRYMPERPARTEKIARRPRPAREWTEADEQAALAEDARRAEARKQSIAIMQGSFGCAGCTSHYDVDPYWNSDLPWSEAARGDGMSYSGVIETVHRNPSESDKDFQARAINRAYELEERDGMRESCRQYRG